MQSAPLLPLHKHAILCNKEEWMSLARRARTKATRLRENARRTAVLEAARDAGLLTGTSDRIAGRIRKPLISAAKARSGIQSDTELLEYALARVAMEDDFGLKLIAR